MCQFTGSARHEYIYERIFLRIIYTPIKLKLLEEKLDSSIFISK
jgi:hypothetical protein